MSAHLSELEGHNLWLQCPEGLDMCWAWAWCGLLSGIESFGPHCLELLLSGISPAASTSFSWSKAGLAMGFLLLVYQAADSSCSLTAISKLNVSNLLSCSLASEETFAFSQTFSETPRKAASHYLLVTVGMRL